MEQLVTNYSFLHGFSECLSPQQCDILVDQFHIYLSATGRITISELNDLNIARFAACICPVVQEI